MLCIANVGNNTNIRHSNMSEKIAMMLEEIKTL